MPIRDPDDYTVIIVILFCAAIPLGGMLLWLLALGLSSWSWMRFTTTVLFVVAFVVALLVLLFLVDKIFSTISTSFDLGR